MMEKILGRTKKPERTIEINPYVTDIGNKGHKSAGIVDILLSVVKFGKKKEAPKTNPFLTRRQTPEIKEQNESVAEQINNIPVKRSWIWYIPVVIAEQIEWVKSHTPDGRKLLEKRSEDKARYEQFMSLFDKKD